MPDFDLDQNLLSAGADFKAGNWAHGQAAATLDLRGGFSLNRGIDLELGVGVMALLEAGLHKFLAADAQVRVEASAGLKGQVQLPLDVFGEAGAAVRLEASARAAAMVRLGIGLSVRDFVELARQDAQIDGIALKLLIILLEEVKIQAGVSAKVAFSAMAYANLALTARFIEDVPRGLKPGFTVGGGYGVGLKAGYGYALFAELGLIEPRRFIRRTVDALVDEVYLQLEPALPDPFARRAASYMRYPAKMALRASFEIGMALAEASPTFSNQGGEIAKQCVHVVLEEAQRALLEELAKLALQTFRRALAEVGVSEQVWASSQAQRTAFAAVLAKLPDEPFEISTENVKYWADLITAGLNLGIALADDPAHRPKWQEPLSVLWATSHLAMLSLERISSASVRASALGSVSATASVQPFGGPLPPHMTPPPAVRTFINSALGKPANTAIRQESLVEFLVRDVVLEQLVQEVPEAAFVLDIVAGPTGDSLVEAARVILGNLGAFVPDSNGEVNSQASLAVLAQGLRAYIDVRLKQELAPLLYEATGDQPEVRIYIDEVLITSMDFAVGTAFQKVLEWSSGGLGYRDALREACSSIVMKLFGRSLVVTSDVLMNYAMAQMSTEIERFHDHIDDDGGAAPVLASMFNSDRALVAEVLRETLDICAEVMTPLPAERRAVIRGLLYDLIDTTPANPDADWLDRLRQNFFIPDETNRQRMMQLANELGTQTADYLARFFERVLMKIGEAIAEQIMVVVAEIAAVVTEWTAAMQNLALELAARLLALPQQINALIDEANARLAGALQELERMLDLMRAASFRTTLRNSLGSLLVSSATGLLNGVPGYALLTTGQRNIVRNGLQTAAYTGVGTLVNLVHPAIAFHGTTAQNLLSEVIEVLDDLRAVEPGADAGSEIAAIVRRRVEAATRSVAEGVTGIDLDFTVSWKVPQPAYWSIVEWDWIQPDPLLVTFRANLGRVRLDLTSVVSAVLAALAALPALQSRADTVATALAQFFAAEDAARALEAEQAVGQAQQALAQQALQDAVARDIDIDIASPLPGSVHTQDVDLVIVLEGVPPSFLGRNGLEVQHVFVWLNQTALSLDEFIIEMLPAPGQVQEIDGRGSSGYVAEGAGYRVRQSDSLMTRLEHTADAPRVNYARSSVKDAGRDGYERGFATIMTRTTTASQKRKVEHGSEQPAVHSFDVVTYDPNRRHGKVRDVSHPNGGLRLAARIPGSRFLSGVNTLSVAVVNGSGQDVQQTIVFIVAEQPVEEPTVREPSNSRRKPIRLPSRPVLDPKNLPLGVRDKEQDLNRDERIPLPPKDPTRRPRTRSGQPHRQQTPLGVGASRVRATELRNSAQPIAASLRQNLKQVEQERERLKKRTIAEREKKTPLMEESNSGDGRTEIRKGTDKRRKLK